MSLIIDLQYVPLLGSRLEQFKQSRSRLWLCRCPICGDSAKKKTLKRFYFYHDTRDGGADYISVKCFNCGYSKSFGNFLKEFDEGLYQEYRMEVFKERNGSSPSPTTNNALKQQETISKLAVATKSAVEIDPILLLPTIASLPDNHFAKQYVIDRRLPLWTHSLLRYSDNFKSDVSSFSVEAELMDLPNDKRLIIPFFNKEGDLKVIQGRALEKSGLRYISLKKSETDNKVFGMDRVDLSRTVLVVEGPLDSLFLPNCLATADADLLSAGYGDIIIFDFQPRNREVMKRLLSTINKGYKVVIPPDNYPYKDINDMVKEGGMSSTDLVQFIAKHCYSGIAARMRFSQYCSININ